MNFIDLVLLLLLVLAALRGFRQGAMSQVMAFGGAAVGLVVGAMVAPRVAPAIVEQPGAALALLTLGLLLLSIAFGQALGVAIGMRLRRAVHVAGAAAVDRTAGIAVGMTGVLLTIWLLASVLVQGPLPSLAKQVRQSVIVGTVGDVMPAPPDLFGRVGNYLDQHGFPTVFSGLGGAIAPPVDPPTRGAVAAAQEAGAPATVQVTGQGCGGVSSGSGFVTQTGFVVTNAHVVAGTGDLTVRDASGEYTARAIFVDSEVDLAVLRAPDLPAPSLRWVGRPADRGVSGATLGFPGGQRQMEVKPAAVRSRSQATGRDIYGRGSVTREVLTLSAGVRRGDSGGPFVTRGGRVAGVIFAAAAAEPATGYALTAESVKGPISRAIEANTAVGTGNCRF